jgi:hypothetical protein
MIRVRAGISYALTEAMDDGHCGLRTDELVPLAETLLGVPTDLVRTALDLELADGTVIADSVGETRCTFLAGLHRAERAIAERLAGLSNGTLPWPWIDPDKALPWVTGRIGLALAESQRAAIKLALVSKVPFITGAQEARADAAIGEDGWRARVPGDRRRRQGFDKRRGFDNEPQAAYRVQDCRRDRHEAWHREERNRPTSRATMARPLAPGLAPVLLSVAAMEAHQRRQNETARIGRRLRRRLRRRPLQLLDPGEAALETTGHF